MWLNRKRHFQSVLWLISACLFSNLCDIFIKLIGSKLPFLQVTFIRLLLGTIVLFPILLYKGIGNFYAKNKRLHGLRILIGFGAIACWIFGAARTSLLSITVISGSVAPTKED